VSYADGSLRLEHLEGYDCLLTSLSGQSLQSFRVGSASEQRLVSLPAGVYILTASKGEGMLSFKFIVR
jgi:hypothetical protein